MNYLGHGPSWAVRKVHYLFGASAESRDPATTLEPNTRDVQSSSILGLVWSAIAAGCSGRRIRSDSLGIERIHTDRDDAVVSGLRGDSLTAERWLSTYGCDYHVEEDILGAGTPFVCLYLFGWALGKHWTGWIVGAVPLALSWVFLVRMSSGHYNAGALWLEDVAVFIISVAFLYTRVHERTPPGFKGSTGVWVAILLEAVLANTPSCLAHGIGLIMDDPRSLQIPRAIIWLCKSSVTIGGWALLSNAAKNRQDTVMKTMNMGSSRHEATSGEPKPYVVQRHLMKIMDRSRDLRVTGLSEGELEKLARTLYNQGYREVARYITFFTRKGKAVDTFDLLCAFHRGYTSWMSHGAGNDNIRAWVRVHASSSSFQSIDYILHMRDDRQELTDELARELQRVENRRANVDRSTHRERHNWWLCGAIASYLDHGGDMSGRSDNRSWYALTAAALCENRNALAVIEARCPRTSIGYADAEAMRSMMIEGCRQVLEQITVDERISSGRGIVVTTMWPSKHPVVTYSVAEVWKAEQGREAVVIDEDAFARLRSAQPVALAEESQREILRKSIEMASRVVVRVDLVPLIGDWLVHSRALTDVRATAWRGWLMHLVWVLCVVVFQLTFPGSLLFLSLFSLLATSVDQTDLQIHVVYVGFHLWRSWIGKIALLPPFANMDDTDIIAMATWAWWAAVVVVNWVGVYLGTLPWLWCRTCCLVIMVASVLPGFIYLVLERNDGGVDGSMRYVGRSRGPGYEHRNPELQWLGLRRSVGRDVIVEDFGDFKIASELVRGQDVGGANGDQVERLMPMV